jgi:outer membrane protein assembly factor BamB
MITTRRCLHHGLVLLVLTMSCLAVIGFGESRSFAAAPESNSIDKAVLASKLVERAGIRRGICAVLGRDGNLAVELAQAAELLVHVREPSASQVAELRKQADEAGFDIDRLSIEQGQLDKLPYAENVVDIVISSNVTNRLLADLSAKEVLRSLRPEGTALFGATHRGDGSPVDAFKLTEWARKSQATKIKTWSDESGSWVQFSKPPLKGAGAWSHWEHGPDNNPVSEDQIIKFPYMTQFMGYPMYIAMPSITTAAGGRTFLAIGHISHHRREWDAMNKLIARNGYNGMILWERKLPEGYVVHRSAFIATTDTFHMIDGNRCLLIDAQTGRDKSEIRIPGVNGHWKWMVMKDGVLYVLAGKKDPGVISMKGDRTFGGWSWADLSAGYYSKPHVPWGFGNTLAAYDLKNKKLIWKHTEKQPIDSRSLALGSEKIYLYCPGLHIRGLETSTGKVLWTNSDKETLNLIEEPGKKLVSTPGFRSSCLTVATPDALIIQGQTRMNVVAISTSDGYQLWTKKKFTNNPNAIYVDGRVILGVGPKGSHVALDPISGAVLEDLKFLKRACTRLTASSDSFFVRGEGTLRYDRESKKVMVDGAVRPACNDGALPANGLLYLGPWQCDCNLSLIGNIARCSAGDFQFDITASDADRLQTGAGDIDTVVPLDISENDWHTYSGNNQRSSATKAAAGIKGPVTSLWRYSPDRAVIQTTPTAAGGLVFAGGEDGKVRAIDAKRGTLRWAFSTSGPIKYAPSIADGRAYFGSGDGYAYCLEAATGRFLWRFRAAPVERHILVYGNLISTWPVNSGVLVSDGVAYFAGGIIDHDGTYVYALDAKSGELVWQNNSTGHLNNELRKGVSVQGNLTIQGDRLILAGGNQISPAGFDLKTGKSLDPPKTRGVPQSNNGRFVGVFGGNHVIAGGRILYSAAQNVSTKGSFAIVTKREGQAGSRNQTLSYGGIPPAWDDDLLALVNFKNGKLTTCDAEKLSARIASGLKKKVQPADRRGRSNLAASMKTDGTIRWESDLGESNKFEAISLAICPNAIVAVVQFQQRARAQPVWQVVAFNRQQGKPYWRAMLNQEPIPGGLLVDRDGRVVVSMLNGDIVSLGRRPAAKPRGAVRDTK